MQVNPITKSQIQKIHIAQKALNLEDEAYRGLLHNLFRVSSCKRLSRPQAAKLLAEFRRLGWQPKWSNALSYSKGDKQKFNELGHRPGMASPAMLRKIEAMWMDISWSENKSRALRHFLFARFGVIDLKFLTFGSASSVIEALKRMQVRQAQPASY